jgi:hypothetical protein
LREIFSLYGYICRGFVTIYQVQHGKHLFPVPGICYPAGKLYHCPMSCTKFPERGIVLPYFVHWDGVVLASFYRAQSFIIYLAKMKTSKEFNNPLLKKPCGKPV